LNFYLFSPDFIAGKVGGGKGEKGKPWEAVYFILSAPKEEKKIKREVEEPDRRRRKRGGKEAAFPVRTVEEKPERKSAPRGEKKKKKISPPSLWKGKKGKGEKKKTEKFPIYFLFKKGERGGGGNKKKGLITGVSPPEKRWGFGRRMWKRGVGVDMLLLFPPQ